MHYFNFTPIEVLSNVMYELYVGFSSTHPKVDEWIASRRAAVREVLGEPVEELIDTLTNYRLMVEAENGDLADFKGSFKALDALATQIGLRPPGWVPSGDTHGVLQAPNLSTMMLWLVEGVQLSNQHDDNLSNETVARMVTELRQSLPRFGDENRPWVLKFDCDENAEPGSDFVLSEVSEAVFLPDRDCDPEPYRVNGKYVQFNCPLGWCTVWQGEVQQ